MFKQLISLATSGGTLATMWLLGRKDFRGWYMGLISQAIWLVFIFSFSAWGLLPLSVSLTIMYVFNLRKWRRDDRPHVLGEDQGRPAYQASQ
jgi:hypothetical protein